MITEQKINLYYRITPKDQIVQFSLVNQADMYQNSSQLNFIRKVVSLKDAKRHNSAQFYMDSQFSLATQSNQYELTRLYFLYEKQVLLFPEDQRFSSYIEKQSSYNSFMAESGLISYDYLRTLFITQKINKEGFYEYIVKRNGQYFLQYCDDIIPIDKTTKRPLWNLSIEHPWQLLLFKVWLKFCGSLENLQKAKPFQLLQSFGLAQYQVFNFRKQLRFMKKQKKSQELKRDNIRSFAMNKSDVIILAKTVEDQLLYKVGLIPNFAAYRVLRITKPDQLSLFRVYSTLPCFWVGSYSPINNSKLNQVFNPLMYLDLERNFLMTQEELIKYFNKFYVVPSEVNQPESIRTQDCLNVHVTKGKPIWINFEAISSSGLIAISIQLPKESMHNRKYPQLRYFLSRYIERESTKVNYKKDFISQQNKPYTLQIQSECERWEYFMVNYIQGYHHNGCFFAKLVQGYYVLYVDAQYTGQINIRFDAYLAIKKPQIFHPKKEEIKQIFDSTFYSISKDMSVLASIDNQNYEQAIFLNGSFEQLGFGSVAIKTEANAKHKIAMRIFPQRLRKHGLKILDHYNQFQDNKNVQKSFVFVSTQGRPEIIVMQKIFDRSQNTIGVAFPPPGTIQFFKLTPYAPYN